MKLAVSIADLPLNINQVEIVNLLEESDVHSIEIMHGPRFDSKESIDKLLKKQDKIQVSGIHAPIIDIPYLFNINKAFQIASEYGASVTFHPLPYSLESDRQKMFFEKVSCLSRYYKTKALLENMGNASNIPFVSFLRRQSPESTSIVNANRVGKLYGFGLTVDTSHLEIEDPFNQEFESVFDSVENIHISSFSSTKQHLPLDEGLLNSKNFLTKLRAQNYNKRLTIEITPNIWYNKLSYKNGLKKSIKIINDCFMQ